MRKGKRSRRGERKRNGVGEGVHTNGWVRTGRD